MLISVVIDAYGPGMFLVDQLKQKGSEVIHIQTTKDIPMPFISFIENAGFVEKIIYDNNLDDIISVLEKYPLIECIIPGFETSVKLADVISERLGIKTNGIILSLARRSKFEMMEALRARNIPTVKYIKTNNFTIAIDWIKNETYYPVVVKPVDSASSEDVYICKNEAEVVDAFSKIINKKNLMGSENEDVLVQSYLTGTEYVVNSVSCAGKHYISDIWVCKKRNVDGRIIYDKEEIIPSQGQIQSELEAYMMKVLDALGIKYGPAHSELILTKDGPILIETGARVGGAVNPRIHEECFGHSQIDLTIDAYLDPLSFAKKSAKPYSLNKYLYTVMAISEKEGLIKEMSLIEDIKKLETIRHARFKKKPGDKLQKTTDLNTSPATIYMASENQLLLEAEYQKLLLLCETGFQLV